MVLHCGQEWGWGAEVLGSPRGAPASVAGRDPAADSQVDVASSPGDQHSSRTWGILGKHHDLLPKKCLLTELPPLGTLTCGIGGTLFSDIRALYSTWGADAWHQPSCATVNGGLLQSVGVTSALDSSSIPFPRCDVIFLLLTWTSTKRHPSLLPILEFVTCSSATELIVLSLQSLP